MKRIRWEKGALLLAARKESISPLLIGESESLNLHWIAHEESESVSLAARSIPVSCLALLPGQVDQSQTPENFDCQKVS